MMRTGKETDRARPTHSLKMAEGGTCQDTERIRPIEAHSQTGDGRQRDLSGHRNNPTDRGPLTSWRRQTEGPVRTPKDSDRPRPTHQLETADRATCQDTETIQPIKAHSPTGDGRQRGLSGHRRIRPTEAHSPTGDGRQRDLSGHRNNPTNRGPLTNWRWQTERLVRTQKQSDRPRPTHQLEMADRGTCQDTETIRPTEAHSLPGDGRQRDLSGHQNNPTDRGPLTSWRR